MNMTTIYLAGDSTVSSYPDRPVQGGWGEFLHRYTAQGVSVDNRAIGGRSSKHSLKKDGLIKYWLTFSLGTGCLHKWGTMMLQRRSPNGIQILSQRIKAICLNIFTEQERKELHRFY